MKKTFKINKENLVHVFAVATEGSDWLWIDYPNRFKKFVSSDEQCREDKWADVLLNSDGRAYIIAVDYNDDEEDGEEGKEYEIRLTDMERGLEIFKKKYPDYFSDLLEDKDDYYTCNNLMQCVMFGEVVYG